MRWGSPIDGLTLKPFGPGGVPDTGALRHGWADTRWGKVRIAWRDSEIMACGFGVGPSPGLRPPTSGTQSRLDSEGAQAWVDLWMAGGSPQARGALLRVRATPFQVRVWRALLEVPRGARVSYGTLAARLGIPRGARAVGAACGANPLALWVPCHRVVRADGGLHGYRWGIDRKRDLLAWEAAPPSG